MYSWFFEDAASFSESRRRLAKSRGSPFGCQFDSKSAARPLLMHNQGARRPGARFLELLVFENLRTMTTILTPVRGEGRVRSLSCVFQAGGYTPPPSIMHPSCTYHL